MEQKSFFYQCKGDQVCSFGDRQVCKTPVLGEIRNLSLNTSSFQWRFNMLLWSSEENISHSFVIAQKLGILLTGDA